MRFDQKNQVKTISSVQKHTLEEKRVRRNRLKRDYLSYTTISQLYPSVFAPKFLCTLFQLQSSRKRSEGLWESNRRVDVKYFTFKVHLSCQCGQLYAPKSSSCQTAVAYNKKFDYNSTRKQLKFNQKAIQIQLRSNSRRNQSSNTKQLNFN